MKYESLITVTRFNPLKINNLVSELKIKDESFITVTRFNPLKINNLVSEFKIKDESFITVTSQTVQPTLDNYPVYLHFVVIPR